MPSGPVAPTADDSLVFLGDYVDRGPDSSGVLDRLLKLRGSCEVVYSDHTENWPITNPGTEMRISRFADAVAGVEEPDITAADAFVALQVSHAALRSIREATPVEPGLSLV